MKKRKNMIFMASLLSAALLLPACGGAGVPAASSDQTKPADEPIGTADEPTVTTAAEPFIPAVAGIPLTDFSVIYPFSSDEEEGKQIAELFARTLGALCGAELTVTADLPLSNTREHEIVIGHSTRLPRSKAVTSAVEGPYDYRMEEAEGRLYVGGGSSYGLRAALEELAGLFRSGTSVPAGYSAAGTSYGKLLIPRTEGSDLRLLSNNTWNCDANRWQSLGEDCSAPARYRGLCAVYLALEPDVICFQEMTAVMIGLLQKELTAQGRSYSLLTYTSGSVKPYTCILYRSDRLELLEQGHHDFAYGNDANSKGYTWGYFEMKETGKRFVALSTHLWWKSETAEAGSNGWRESQAKEICAATAEMEKKYGCPVFAMGDFNCNTNSQAYKNFLSGGFADTFDLATGFRDDNKGYHTCTASGYAREKVTPYKGNAIDHIMLRNPCGTEVLTFDHTRPMFYIKLSDHYPVFVDVKLANK